jgi:hypothetical protein
LPQGARVTRIAGLETKHLPDDANGAGLHDVGVARHQRHAEAARGRADERVERVRVDAELVGVEDLCGLQIVRIRDQDSGIKD